ncbi:MAG TPA: S41 family peptidase [Chthonomonadaceae bacterium]|nr:S41 family peptidase [Chthonomonadaceae bacterium]
MLPRISIPFLGVLLLWGGLSNPKAHQEAGPVGQPPAAAAPPATLRAGQRNGLRPARRQDSPFAAQLDQIWRTVNEHFYARDFNGVDWQRVGEVYRDRLPQAQTKAEFETLANTMLGELHASHTGYYDENDMEFYMLPAVMAGDLRGHQVEHIGVMGRREGEGYGVTAVINGSPAEKAGIRSGDLLLTADGQPFTSAGSFRGKSGMPVRVTLRRAGAPDLLTVTVTPVRQNILSAFLEATRQSARIVDVGGRRLGYVHLWTMAHPAFRSALDQIVTGQLHATDGLILDLRDGYGGSPFGYEDVFLRPDISWEETTHRGPQEIEHLGYNKPMVVLINSGTRSAKEFLSYQLKNAHRAILVGTNTAGAFLGAQTFEIGRDGVLELAVAGLRVDGRRLEGVGVAPDLAVAADATYTDHDRQMARAEQVLIGELGDRMTHR